MEKESGTDAVNRELLDFFMENTRSLSNTIIDTSPRCYEFPEFWTFLLEHGYSLHMAGMPGDVMERMELREIVNPERDYHLDPRSSHKRKLSDIKIHNYEMYLRHYLPCLQADFVIHLEGILPKDVPNIRVKVLTIRNWLEKMDPSTTS